MDQRSVGLQSAAGQYAVDQRIHVGAAPTPEQPMLDQMETALLALCDQAMRLRHRIDSTADRVLGPRPPMAVPEAGKEIRGTNDIHSRPAIVRIQAAIRGLRDELEGAHREQERLDTL